MENIKNGLYQFNACLVGTVVPSLYPLVYGGDLGYMTWVVVVVMSAMRYAQVDYDNIEHFYE